MRRSLVSVLLVIAGIQLISAEPDFDPLVRTQAFDTQAGNTIAFECAVLNQFEYDVSWWFMDHNVQISHNQDILVNSTRFQIKRPPGSDGMWNLEIRNISVHDQGYYQCRIDKTVPIKVQSNWLGVVEANRSSPEIPDEMEPADFTDCCIAAGVRTACLPVCNPSTITLDFVYSNCELDLLKLLKCGADGRNHAPCCFRRGLPGKCLGFCANDPPAVVDSAYQVCLDRAEDITACMMEGNMVLPSAPQMLTVSGTTPTALTLSWTQPAENAQDLLGYKVFHKQLESGEAFTSSMLIRGKNTLTVDSLSANTAYTVYVIAINAHGSSLPSERITSFTSQDGPMVPGSNQTLLDCCKSRGVSEECQPVLCGKQISSVNTSLTMQCLAHYDKVSACLSGERDHSVCCRQRGIPDHCGPVCAGRGFTNYTQLDCITTLMPQISSCFIENTGKLPSPPRNVRLERVEADSILVQWEASESGPQTAGRYAINYGRILPGSPALGVESYGMVDFKTIIVPNSANSYILTRLEPSTYYDIQLLAFNTEGFSLPSPTITALTKFSTESAVDWAPPPIPSMAPSDPMSCCKSKNITSQCQQMCDYDVDFNQFSSTEVIMCAQQIPKILACGSNGRNHTQCCYGKGVNTDCLQFCSLTHEEAESFTISPTHIPCVFSIDDVVGCMRSGQAITPSPPRNLTVITHGTHTLSVGWYAPVTYPKIGDQNYYIVRIREVGVDFWTAMGAGPAATLTYIFQSLKPDTSYEMQVLAHNGNGTSLPSPTVTARTLTTATTIPPLLPNTTVTIPTDVMQCCRDQGVTGTCLSACNGASVSSRQCNSSLPGMLTCAADGRDHSRCCQRYNIPSACLPYCKGQKPSNPLAGVVCLAFTEQLITCFHEGQENLPGQPTSMSLEAVNQTTITVSWRAPPEAGSDLTYTLMYSRDGDQQYTYIENVKSPYTIAGLTPNTFYSLSVYAVNSHGSSQPTDTYTVRTLQDNAPTIQIIQSPPGYVRVGQNITLTCVATGDPYPSTGWLMRDGSIQQGSTLSIRYLAHAMADSYVCVATAGSNRWTRRWFLKVQTAASVTPFASVVYATPNVGDSVYLVCQFSGYPDQFSWKQGNAVLSTGQRSRYRTLQKEDNSSATIDYGLEIQGVVDEDFTAYICSGGNGVGPTVSARIQLMDATKPPPTPPVNVAPAVDNITACCIGRGVVPECQEACSWDIDIDALQQKGKALPCLGDLDHLIQCAADGKDHSACCRNDDVPPACMSFCAGTIPSQLDISHLVCLSHINVILRCMQRAQQKVPGEPQDVHAQITHQGYIEVFWSVPVKNKEAVDRYTVYWSSPSLGTHYQDVVKNKLSYTIQGIHTRMRYTVWVTARNDYGNSKKSTLANVVTDDLMPSAPLNLRTVTGTQYVRLDWDIPAKHPGGVLYYIVHYRVASSSKPYKTANTTSHDNTFRLVDLDPDTTYEMYVTAKSSHFESAPSVLTLAKSWPGAQKSVGSDDSSNKTAIGLAVFFTLLIVLAIVALVAFWYLRIRKPKQRFDDSVAFENPGYATAGGRGGAAGEAKVHGIPNGNFTESEKQTHSNNSDAIYDQPAKDAPPVRDSSAIMREAPDAGYTSLSQEGVVNPTYATLDPVDAGHVDLTANATA